MVDRRGKHYGALAGGFAEGLLQSIRLSIMMQHYQAMQQHWLYMEGKGRGGAPPPNVFGGGASGDPWAGGGGTRIGEGADSGAYTGTASAAAHGAEMSQYLQDKYGLTSAGASAVVGNAWQESNFASNFKPGGDKGTAAGMFQWREGRQADARQWMQENGKDPNDWRSHLDYAMHETERDYPKLYDELKTTKDADAATRSFFSTFERGDPGQANMSNRTGMAKAVMNRTGDEVMPKVETAKVTDKDTAKVAPIAKPDAKPDAKGGDASAQADTPYKTAGLDWTGVSAEGAKRAAADLAAHRVSDTVEPPPLPVYPGDQHPQTGFEHGITDPATMKEGLAPQSSSPAPVAPPSAPPPGYLHSSSAIPPTLLGPPASLQAGEATINPQTDVSSVSMGPYLQDKLPPQMGPEGPGRTTLPPEWSNMPFPGQRDPRGVYAPKPTVSKPAAKSKDADKPTRGAQPAAASAPTRSAIPPTPDPRMIQYGTAERGPGSTPWITVANWGANPPVASRGVTPGVTSSPSSPSMPAFEPPARLPDDMANDAMLGMQIMGSRRGGPIQRFANGGAPSRPVTRFQAGGAGQAAIAAMESPSYVGPTGGGGWQGTPYAQLAPNQQAWANTTQGLLGQIQQGGMQDAAYWSSGGKSMTGPVDTSQYANQLTTMPTAIWPTPAASAAPAAPSGPVAPPGPVTPPTTVATAVNPLGSSTTGAPASVTGLDNTTTNTTTGAFNLPNLTTPMSPAFGGDQGGTNYAGSQNQGGSNYNVDTSGNTTIFSARGGAIPRVPMRGYAAAGQIIGSYDPGAGYTSLAAGQPRTPSYTQAQHSDALAALNYMGGLTGAPYNASQMTGAMADTGLQNAMFSNDWGTMTPQQQQTYNAIKSGSYQYQAPTPAPAPAPTPAPAPAPAAPVAAPTPVPPPATVATALNPAGDAATSPIAVTGVQNADTSTTGTTTGAFNLPNLSAPSSPAFGASQGGVDYTNAQAAAGVNYGVDDYGNTTILSARGGPMRRFAAGGIPRNPMMPGLSPTPYGTSPTPTFRRGGRAMRFDDGGLVDPGAAALGPPPGLSGGGAQPVPPIYFNPSTYSAAGAPVNKGVSQSTVPVISVAGAIPTMPMARGGAVGYQEGGDVESDMMQADQENYMMDMEGGRGGAQPASMSSSELLGVTPAQFAAPTPTNFETPPVGANSVSPQVTDNNGNPAKGLIDAIQGGLHNLGSALGLGGGRSAAIASDPGTQDGRHNFARGGHPDGTPGMTDQDIGALHKAIDPNDQLTLGMKQMMGMEAVRNWYMNQGNEAGAEKTAAMMMQKSVELSQRFGDQAYQHFYKGDMQGAVGALNQAKAMIADGTLMNARVADDGNSIIIDGQNLKGQQLWQRVIAPQQLLGVIAKVQDGSAAWHLYETAAGKYASDYGDRVKKAASDEYDRRTAERDQASIDRQQRAWDHQQAVLDAREKAKTDKASADEVAVNAAFGDTGGAQPAIPREPQPAYTSPVAPEPTPINASPAVSSGETAMGGTSGGASPDASGAAVSHGPPADADSNAPTVDRAASELGVPKQDIALTTDQGAQDAYSHVEQMIMRQYPPPRPPNMAGLDKDQQAMAIRRHQAELAQYKADVAPMRDAMFRDLAARAQNVRQAQGDLNRQNLLNRGNILKEQLDEHNANFAAGLKFDTPYTPEETNKIWEAKSPQSYLAEAITGQPLSPDPQGKEGQGALKAFGDAGYDPGVARAMTEAFRQAVQHSPNTSPESIAQGIVQLANGADGQGRAVNTDWGKRYAISVVQPNGSHIDFNVPAGVMNDLTALGRTRQNAAVVKQSAIDAARHPAEMRPSMMPDRPYQPPGPAQMPILQKLFAAPPRRPDQIVRNPPPDPTADPRSRNIGIPRGPTPLNDDIYSPLRRGMPLQ